MDIIENKEIPQNPEEEKKKKVDKEINLSTIFYFLSEISFVILPLIVISIVYLCKNEIIKLFYSPEWSFATTIIIGQIILKLISIVLNSKNSVIKYRVEGSLAFAIVFGLIPSSIFLVFFLLEITPFWLVIVQIIYFIMSLFAFYLIIGMKTDMELNGEIKN
jgi:hypothetical protein